MTVLIFLIISYVLLSFSLFLLFPKAGKEGWKGLVPGLNFLTWAEIIGRPAWYPLLLLIPIVNLFIFCGMAVDMVRSFGQYKLVDSSLAVIYSPAIFFKLAKSPSIKYLGPTIVAEREYHEKLRSLQSENNQYKLKKLKAESPFEKSQAREWFESIVFAVFAAGFIRMFLIEAFVIPTPSMEGSLLVGDYLFVSKVHYGMRTPQTVLQVPLLHNRLPIVNRESYIEKPNLPYFRLPAIQTIERGSPIVFNWPVGDSVYVAADRAYTIGQIRRGEYTLPNKLPLTVRPVDKKDHYIKRAVGMPGDTLRIVDRVIYINGTAQQEPQHVQFAYQVSSTNTRINFKRLDEAGVNLAYCHPDMGLYYLTNDQVKLVKSLGPDIKVEPWPMTPRPLFPHFDVAKGWSVDNYGPIVIPSKGMTIQLTDENIKTYWRAIQVYEGNDLRIENDKVILNGVASEKYTFRQDYYWAMGDNRHNSEDSRAWGFVPFDHIVGKPLFIWFSTKNGSAGNGINWNRIFKSATSD